MKSIARFLLAVLCSVPVGAHCANIPATRGNNLTAYNGASGSTNNNNWNALMNVRSGVDAADMPVADFGNCNAVILRCASPKCGNGGCTDMSVTSAIVDGCVRSNASCAQYGDALVEYISAQLVASSTAKANAAQNAAATAAAQQSAQQIQAMQAQMQQMQSQMAAQNAETVAQLQDALEEQKQLTAQALADASAARTASTTVSATTDSVTNPQTTSEAFTVAEQIALQNGVSPDIAARAQISGQIMSSIENAEIQLKKLKQTMENAFTYAKCDTKGNNCQGPKRVKAFKEKAMDFFEPYDGVVDEIYDALLLAQSVGIGINDIYMMMNDSCNVWGKYLCQEGQSLRYSKEDCEGTNGKKPDKICTTGKIIPPADGGCQPLGAISNEEEVRYLWLNPELGDALPDNTSTRGMIQVGCMSELLDTAPIFRNRKKATNIDISVLERIIEQDAPNVYGSSLNQDKDKEKLVKDGMEYCQVNVDTTRTDLQKIVSLKTSIPKGGICVTESVMRSLAQNGSQDATTKTGCEKDENDRINPEIALCSTHAYNVGQKENPKQESDKQHMRNVIALKTTFMTQQMYKQYEYLEATLKRLKTQLEKAVLTTNLQLATGADTSSSSSSSYSGGTTYSSAQQKFTPLDNATDCTLVSYTESFSCLIGNANLIIKAAESKNNKNITNAKKQLERDLQTATASGFIYKNNSRYCQDKKCETELTKCTTNIKTQDIGDCARALIQVVGKAENNEKKSNRSYNNTFGTP